MLHVFILAVSGLGCAVLPRRDSCPARESLEEPSSTTTRACIREWLQKSERAEAKRGSVHAAFLQPAPETCFRFVVNGSTYACAPRIRYARHIQNACSMHMLRACSSGCIHAGGEFWSPRCLSYHCAFDAPRDGCRRPPVDTFNPPPLAGQPDEWQQNVPHTRNSGDTPHPGERRQQQLENAFHLHLHIHVFVHLRLGDARHAAYSRPASTGGRHGVHHEVSERGCQTRAA